jgi:acyl-CoA reductase-like NAD-dependent aldehyde dehydrogenase
MAPTIDFTTFKNVINGELRGTEKTRHGVNPATKEANPEVPVSTQQDVDDAVKAGKAAFESWKNTTWDERAKAVLAYGEALNSHKEEFAKLLTTEQGKPLAAARDEVMAGYIWAQALSQMKLDDETVEDTPERTVLVRYTPLGVATAIVPWNFPIHLAVGKLVPAVLTGNVVIVKPSPFTPYCGIKLVELAQQFFPPGVVQVLSGDDNLGPWLTAHPGIDKISFTGSTFTGKKVMESAAKTLKRVTLELGGNDPAIVTKNVDVAKVAPHIAELAFANSGQVCLALKRIYIHEDIYNEFRDAMVAHTKANLKLGNGHEAGVTHGPIQNSMQFERVQGFFKDIEKEGWKVAVGGTKAENEAGFFIQPTIIDNPADDSRIVTEEPFGPILPILSYKTEEEVIKRANDTRMGLGASVWTTDMEEAKRIATKLEAGNVWVNSHLELHPAYPFGGHKESGLGHEWGVSGMKQWCNTQAVYLKKSL